MIDVTDVAVSFGEVDVLEDVSLSVPEGRFVGLVGPNGAGKTTLLRAMSGAIEPDRGSVVVNETDVHAASSRETSRSVAVVPQDTTLSFSFDVRDVVAMGRTPHRGRFSPPTHEDRELVTRALERTRTLQFADRAIDAVSGGERQRVILARAIAQDTPTVLLDEPTASLDVNHAIETLELVDRLADDGKTVVAAIHDLNLAARFCDELVVLADGAILDRGPPDRVLTGPRVEQAFDTPAAVTINPVTWTPSVTAVGAPELTTAMPDSVHVVGTGKGAADAVSKLVGADVDCSLGPVPEGDAAAVTARHLDVDRTTVEPFEQLPTDVRTSIGSSIESADVVVFAGAEALVDVEELVPPDATTGIVVVSTRHEGSSSSRREDGDPYDAVRHRAIVAEPPELLDAVATAHQTAVDQSTDERDTRTDRH